MKPNKTVKPKLNSNADAFKPKYNSKEFKPKSSATKNSIQKQQVQKDRDAPLELSTKIKSTSKRTIFKKNKDSRDPRFYDLHGEFKKHEFETRYNFIHDVKKDEVKQVKELLAKSKDNQDLKQTLQSLESQLKQKEHDDKLKKLKLEMKAKMPNYKLNDKKLRVLQLKEQFNKTPKAKLLKLMEKKRSRNSKKERKLMPKKQ